MIQQKNSRRVIATADPLSDLADDHPLLAEPKDLLFLSWG